MRSQLKVYDAPIAGWISNRNIARPGQKAPQGAAVLDNLFPTATTAIMRRGFVRYATLEETGLPVTALFSYRNGANQRLFAANAETIYDITTITDAYSWELSPGPGDVIVSDEGDTIGTYSTGGLEVVEGMTGGDWVVQQFSTTGNVYLIGVNGQDTAFIYDGTVFRPSVAGGLWTMTYLNGTGDFTVGETVTGGTSGATGVIVGTTGDTVSGSLVLRDIENGPFQAGETITDGATGSAEVDEVPALTTPGISFPSGVALTTADLSYVWSYKGRLWFIQRDSMDVWYLPVDQVGGELTKLPMVGVFDLGGTLVFGATWSMDSGADGGLSEQCIFVTDQGEVAVYQGADPTDVNDWSKVGVYRVGNPLGKQAHMKAGGDVLISTTIGHVSVAQAIQRDVAALSPSSVSYPIEDAWNTAVRFRRGEEWEVQIWAENQMVLIAPPTINEQPPVVFAVNARTGAWGRFTGWDVTCMEVFQGRLFAGSTNGAVNEMWVSGADEGQPYTARYIPLFEDFEQPASRKYPRLARVSTRSPFVVYGQVTCNYEFDMSFPPAPASAAVETGGVWNDATWNVSTWGDADQVPILSERWVSVSGSGYNVAPVFQITAGSVAPLDLEIVRVDMTYGIGGVIS